MGNTLAPRHRKPGIRLIVAGLAAGTLAGLIVIFNSPIVQFNTQTLDVPQHWTWALSSLLAFIGIALIVRGRQLHTRATHKTDPSSQQAKARIQNLLRDQQVAQSLQVANFAARQLPASPKLSSSPKSVKHRNASTADAPNAVHEWGPHVWHEIEWKRFSTVVIGLFVQVGFETQRFQPAGLAGIDVLLKSGNGVLLLRCVSKHTELDTSAMKDFLRTLKKRGCSHGTYATSSTFSEAARALASEHKIHTLDGQQLLKLVTTRTPKQQATLLKVAYTGEYWRPTCMRCGIKLVEHFRPEDGGAQWMCINAPKCPVIFPMSTAIHLLSAA